MRRADLEKSLTLGRSSELDGTRLIAIFDTQDTMRQKYDIRLPFYLFSVQEHIFSVNICLVASVPTLGTVRTNAWYSQYQNVVLVLVL
jgi:hypothetical protein